MWKSPALLLFRWLICAHVAPLTTARSVQTAPGGKGFIEKLISVNSSRKCSLRILSLFTSAEQRHSATSGLFDLCVLLYLTNSNMRQIQMLTRTLTDTVFQIESSNIYPCVNEKTSKIPFLPREFVVWPSLCAKEAFLWICLRSRTTALRLKASNDQSPSLFNDGRTLPRRNSSYFDVSLPHLDVWVESCYN